MYGTVQIKQNGEIEMSLLPDWRIRRDVKIVPFSEEGKRKGIISYGVSSYGYDVRVGYKFKIFTPTNCAVVDPKNFDPKSFVDVDITPGHDYRRQDFETGNHITTCFKCGHVYSSFSNIKDKEPIENCKPVPDHILIPPNSFCLAETLEWIEIPRNMLAVAVCKSTYARCAIVIPTTVMESSWKGKITLEISNCSSLPAKVYASEGICQLLFFESNEECEKSYADRDGKYQNQKELTLPFVV